LVVFEIDDMRIRRLAEETLKRAFRHQVNTALEEIGCITDPFLDNLFKFYVCYLMNQDRSRSNLRFISCYRRRQVYVNFSPL